MKIRSKLLALTFGTVVLFGASVATFFALVSPVDEMQKEASVLERVVIAANQLQTNSNRLMVESLQTGGDNLTTSLKEWEAASATMNEVKLLPTISPKVSTALDIIRDLRKVSGPSLEKLAKSLADLKDDSGRVSYWGDRAEVLTFFGEVIPKTPDHKLDTQTRTDIGNFVRAIAIVNLNLDSIQSTLSEQGAVIASEMADLRVRSTVWAATIVLIFVLLAIVVSMLLSRSISISLAEIGSRVQTMGTGDLRVDFISHRKDETGTLGANLNQLIHSFQGSLGDIKESAASNGLVKDGMVQVVAVAMSSAVEIEANSNAIKARMEQLNTLIEELTTQMKLMEAGVAAFSQKIVKQNLHIGNSVAAVTEVMASIENVTRITQKNREEADELVREADRGSEAFEETSTKVSEIAESVEEIQEMASVIAGIATQTKILSLNAAIEAAHAGDSGRGFAVVADEIGKLAEASATSSDEIGRTIASIILKISEADTTRATTTEAFDRITLRVTSVSQSVVEIHQNIQEMNVGGNQILEAMEQLKTSSESVTFDASGLEQGITNVGGNIVTIDRISSEVVLNIGEITAGLQEISRSVHAAGEQSAKLEAIAGVLETAVNRFQIV